MQPCGGTAMAAGPHSPTPRVCRSPGLLHIARALAGARFRLCHPLVAAARTVRCGAQQHRLQLRFRPVSRCSPSARLLPHRCGQGAFEDISITARLHSSVDAFSYNWKVLHPHNHQSVLMYPGSREPPVLLSPSQNHQRQQSHLGCRCLAVPLSRGPLSPPAASPCLQERAPCAAGLDGNLHPLPL